jgi:hypothetical protein
MRRRRNLYGARFPEKIAKQVCSLTLAQKLKAGDVPQDSLWYWVPSRSSQHPLLVPAEELSEYPLFQAAAVSAFTAGELGELLPSEIEQQGEFLRLLCLKTPRAFSVAYVLTPADRPSAIESKAPTEAEARAQMLLYLIENKLFTP